MLPALLLGLAGSFTHCAGMCTGVMLLLGRRRGATGWRLLLLHAGRLTTYAALGLLAGALGQTLGALAGMSQHAHGVAAGATAPVLPSLALWQGILSLLAAAAAVFMALALLGRAPSPELLLTRVTRWWGRTARGIYIARPQKDRDSQPGLEAHLHLRRSAAQVQVSAGLSWSPGQPAKASSPTQPIPWAQIYLSGLFWGLLPCGMVLAGLPLAAASGSTLAGGLTMLAFGAGTLLFGLAAGWAARQIKPSPLWAARLRPAAAMIIFLFGVQMALRGLAAWGWVAHGNIGAVPLW